MSFGQAKRGDRHRFRKPTKYLKIVFCHELKNAAPGLVGIGAKSKAVVAPALHKAAAVGICEIELILVVEGVGDCIQRVV